MAVLLTLDPPTLVGQIADLLRQRIITGHLQPGERIRQDQYAEAFGVSRTPLREAFRLLEAEGWIHLRPRSGVVVSEFSIAEINDILAMRLLLEPLAIRARAATHGPADESLLEALHAGLGDRASRHDQDGDEYDAANQAFHFALYGITSLPAIDPIHASLRGYWERYARYQLVYRARTVDSIRRSNDEHDALLEAWLARDRARAEHLLGRHILSAGCSLIRILSEEGQPKFSPLLLELAERYDVDLD
jgi:DNA-binding GntR family transcriptional regulator